MKRWAWVSCLLLLVFAGPVCAHDTDQFTVPVGQEMADLGPMLSARYAEIIRKGVTRLNDRIERALKARERPRRPVQRGGNRPNTQHIVRVEDPAAVLERCYSAEGVGRAVYDAFGPAVELIEGLEHELYTDKCKAKFPGKLTAYKAKSEWNSIYNKAYSPIDPRNISAIFHASTVRMFDVYLGNDKIGHFTDMGFHYFKTYLAARRDGKSEDDAMLATVRLGTQGVFSERGLLGYITAGSYSNADLVSNYTGCLFYRNLTEPVVLKGQLYESILVRDGDFWKVRDDLDDASFFERFISDHWNEALNPSLYDPLMRGTIRRLVHERNPALLEWYKDKYADQDPAEYFTRLTKILSTYYGDPYGHNGDPENLVHIGNTITDE